MVPSVRSKSLAIEIWMMPLLMTILMMVLMMVMTMMILMMLMMNKPYDYDGDTDDDHAHKNEIYTAAGAAPGASVPCSWFLAIWSRPFGPGPGYSLAAGYSVSAGY